MTDAYSTEALPQLEDGRSYITAEMWCDQPHLKEMIELQREFWRDGSINQDIVVASEPGEIVVRMRHYG